MHMRILIASMVVAVIGCGDDGGGAETTTGSTTSDDTTSSSTTSDDTTSSSTSGVDSTSTTGNDALGWGDCKNNPEEVACMPEEFCGEFGGANVCMKAGCAKTFDCPEPLPGSDRDLVAPIVCGDVSPLSEGSECFYLCSGGQTCIAGMTCTGDVCAYP